jgi:hypothetical protein
MNADCKQDRYRRSSASIGGPDCFSRSPLTARTLAFHGDGFAILWIVTNVTIGSHYAREDD